MRLNDLLNQLAIDLNDAETGREFTGWSTPQLRFYLLEGLREALELRPELFHETIIIEINHRETWQELCSCLNLTPGGVLGQSTEKGRVLHSLKHRPDDYRLTWRGPECPPSEPFRLREFSISPNGRALRVYPPPPPGQPCYLALRCAVWPEGDNPNLPDELTAALLQWGQYRALMMDGESNQLAYQAALAHKATFYELMALERSVQAATSRRPS